jgi:hypothetical protein
MRVRNFLITFQRTFKRGKNSYYFVQNNLNIFNTPVYALTRFTQAETDKKWENCAK